MSIRFRGIFILMIVFTIATLTWNCEKDDICDPLTPVTPRLIIDFYTLVDNMPAVVPKLEIAATNYDTVYRNVSSIKLPLGIYADASEFDFTITIGNEEPPLIYTDNITFNYTRANEYVSRACGYKTVFEFNSDPQLAPPIVLNGTTPLIPGTWIKNILVQNYSVTSENETHVKIYY